jgi:hypothetical protein
MIFFTDQRVTHTILFMKPANHTSTDNTPLLHDSDNIRELFQQVGSIAASYLAKLVNHPTSLKEVPAINLSLPEKGLGATLVNWRTTENDIQIAVDELVRAYV